MTILNPRTVHRTTVSEWHSSGMGKLDLSRVWAGRMSLSALLQTGAAALSQRGTFLGRKSPAASLALMAVLPGKHKPRTPQTTLAASTVLWLKHLKRLLSPASRSHSPTHTPSVPCPTNFLQDSLCSSCHGFSGPGLFFKPTSLVAGIWSQSIPWPNNFIICSENCTDFPDTFLFTHLFEGQS